MANSHRTSVDALVWSEASAVVSDRPVMTGGWLHSIGAAGRSPLAGAAKRASREADHAGDTCPPREQGGTLTGLETARLA
jgi:hypothetical protein